MGHEAGGEIPQGDRTFDHLRLGKEGERRVALHYEAMGFRVLERNWRCPSGELDLVLSKGRLVVFCEVKARSSTRWGSPLEAVDRRRVARLRSAAAHYLSLNRRVGDREVRFDVAGVVGARVELVEGAF